MITTNIKILLLISLLLCISCGLKKRTNDRNGNTLLPLKLKELKLNKPIQELISKSRSEFVNKAGIKPNVIVLQLNQVSGLQQVEIENHAFLYLDEEAVNFSNNNFVAAKILKGTIILLKDSENLGNIVSIGDKDIEVNLKYGSMVYVCYKRYILEGRGFSLEQEYCTDDLVIE